MNALLGISLLVIFGMVFLWFCLWLTGLGIEPIGLLITGCVMVLPMFMLPTPWSALVPSIGFWLCIRKFACASWGQIFILVIVMNIASTGLMSAMKLHEGSPDLGTFASSREVKTEEDRKLKGPESKLSEAELKEIHRQVYGN